jgi:hypothetical protein
MSRRWSEECGEDEVICGKESSLLRFLDPKLVNKSEKMLVDLFSNMVEENVRIYYSDEAISSGIKDR